MCEGCNQKLTEHHWCTVYHTQPTFECTKGVYSGKQGHQEGSQETQTAEKA